MSDQYVTEVPVTESGNLACPFCGGVSLTLIVSRAKPDISWITCNRCGATGPNMIAPIGWNMRAFGESLYFRSQDFEQLKQLDLFT